MAQFEHFLPGVLMAVFLRERGYRLEDELMLSRFATVAGPDKKHELILFYIENVATTAVGSVNSTTRRAATRSCGRRSLSRSPHARSRRSKFCLGSVLGYWASEHGRRRSFAAQGRAGIDAGGAPGWNE